MGGPLLCQSDEVKKKKTLEGEKLSTQAGGKRTWCFQWKTKYKARTEALNFTFPNPNPNPKKKKRFDVLKAIFPYIQPDAPPVLLNKYKHSDAWVK